MHKKRLLRACFRVYVCTIMEECEHSDKCKTVQSIALQ
jgi:hypothetical protein